MPDVLGRKRTALEIPKARRPEERGFVGTEQQMHFIREWAAGNSIAAAARRAGYKDMNSGYEMARNPYAVAMYEQEKAKYESADNMSRERFMDMLRESYDMAKLMSEPASMVAAAREIGKACGYYAPSQTVVNLKGDLALEKMNKLSDRELAELMQSANRQLDAVVNEIIEVEEKEHVDPSAVSGLAQRHSETAAEAAPDPRDEDEG